MHQSLCHKFVKQIFSQSNPWSNTIQTSFSIFSRRLSESRAITNIGVGMDTPCWPVYGLSWDYFSNHYILLCQKIAETAWVWSQLASQNIPQPCKESKQNHWGFVLRRPCSVSCYSHSVAFLLRYDWRGIKWWWWQWLNFLLKTCIMMSIRSLICWFCWGLFLSTFHKCILRLWGLITYFLPLSSCWKLHQYNIQNEL